MLDPSVQLILSLVFSAVSLESVFLIPELGKFLLTGFKVQLLSFQVVFEAIDIAGAVVSESACGHQFLFDLRSSLHFLLTLGAKSRDDLHQTKYPFAYDGWGFPQGGAERFLVQWTGVFDF